MRVPPPRGRYRPVQGVPVTIVAPFKVVPDGKEAAPAKFVAVAALPDHVPAVLMTNGEATVPAPERGAVTPVKPANAPPQLVLVSEGWQTWTGVPEGYR